MAEATIHTRAEMLAVIARRLRKHYGERLRQLLVLGRSPVPDELGGLHLVVVLEESFDRRAETRLLADLAVDITDEEGLDLIPTLHPVSEEQLRSDTSPFSPAALAREEGVLL